MNLCKCNRCNATNGVFKVNPPPPKKKFSDFFLKSEVKEIESKRKKNDVGGRGYFLTYFWSDIFSSGVEIFSGGLRNFREGLRNFRGGLIDKHCCNYMLIR